MKMEKNKIAILICISGLIISSGLLIFIKFDKSEEGYRAINSEKFDSAIETFEKLIRKEPANHINYNSLAASYHGLHEHDSAIKYYSISFKLEPTFYYAIANRGITKNELC